MNVETFKICSRAFFPNCYFRKSGILVDTQIDSDDGFYVTAATMNIANGEVCTYAKKAYYFSTASEDFVEDLRLYNEQ